MAIMDFIGILGQQEWTSMFLAKSRFLERLLSKYAAEQDPYGFITNNLITLGAFVYSQNPEVFDALKNPDYILFMKRYFASKSLKDQETACTCMYFFFKRRVSITDFFVNNLDMLTTWLSYARTTDGDLKRAFLVGLRELLKAPKSDEERDKVNEIVRRLFSNLTSHQKFPDMGNENASIEYLVKASDVPFEEVEREGLRVIKKLLNWEWGMRALFANSMAVNYLLNRGGALKAKDILETKYRLIQKTLQSKYFFRQAGVIDPVIGSQLEVYYSQGVFGTEGGAQFVPEYSSKAL